MTSSMASNLFLFKDAYPKFVDWAKDITDADAKDWYKYPAKGKVIPKE